MKQLTCEICGSTDLLKQDGVFVCQSCGCKYSVEEAKKMMIEGVVEVTGTVKVDNNENVENYLQNARHAKNREDWEETQKYYSMVEQHQPNNVEANFYSAYGKVRTSLMDTDIYKREQAFKVLSNCMPMIENNYDKEKDNESFIKQISTDIISLASNKYVYEKRIVQGREDITDSIKTLTYFNELHYNFIKTLENIISLYEDESKVIYIYYIIINHYKCILSHSCQKGEFAYKSSDPFNGPEGSLLKVCLPTVQVLSNKITTMKNKISSIETKNSTKKYWEEHQAEKQVLEKEQAEIKKKIEKLNAKISEIDYKNAPKIKELNDIRNQKLLEEIEFDKQYNLIQTLESQRANLGMFKGKEKKALTEQIVQERTKLDVMEKTAQEAKSKHIAEINQQINSVREDGKEFRLELSQLSQRNAEIISELTKAR